MVIETTKCAQFNHLEFSLEADGSHVPDIYLKNVVGTIEGMVAAGCVFKPGQTFQVGWMTTEVRSRGDDKLTLFEPNMKGMPIEWVT